ncbi:MAG: MBL fold metallo-hydrolase [Lachnospiraceae bacterium]|nr:MBL fold metallo-hydrolase [Lachnospiraceae bacterium]
MTDHITINVQSSIRIEAKRQVIYFDPIQIEDEAHDADLIFLTHNHSDHFDPECVNKLFKGNNETYIVCPLEMRDEIQQKTVVEHNDIVPLRPGDALKLNGFPVEAVRAYNIGKEFHPKENNWLGYVVTVNGERIYVTGDTDVTEDAKAVKCDIAIVPVGGKYTMTAEEAAALVNEIKPKTAIPCHYGFAVGSVVDAQSFVSQVNDAIATEIKY